MESRRNDFIRRLIKDKDGNDGSVLDREDYMGNLTIFLGFGHKESKRLEKLVREEVRETRNKVPSNDKDLVIGQRM